MSLPISMQVPAAADIWRRTAPLPYTSNPWRLFFSDLRLFLSNTRMLPFLVWPVTPCDSGRLDELYPSLANVFCVIVHVILSVAQIIFLLSLPLCFVFLLPLSVVSGYVIVFVIANALLCRVLLNGGEPTLESRADLGPFKDKHEDERWIFLNGVAVGSHWLQSNIDRLSLTFGRKILGVHNPTFGVIFDILQCVMQRDFTYVTQDIRNGYAVLKKALSDSRCKKVVFILHSQGGIEGGLILDWLFAEVPGELIEKLEVYTFGNAANHFNNPLRNNSAERVLNGASRDGSPDLSRTRTIAHIEHYANHFDYVSRCGVLEFASESSKQGRTNRFAGRCFEQHGKGHLFNQHYLGTMFPLDKKRGYGVAEDNSFINAKVQLTGKPVEEEDEGSSTSNIFMNGDVPLPRVLVRNLTPGIRQLGPSEFTQRSTHTVRHYSRLWEYRNGKTPRDG